MRGRGGKPERSRDERTEPGPGRGGGGGREGRVRPVELWRIQKRSIEEQQSTEVKTSGGSGKETPARRRKMKSQTRPLRLPVRSLLLGLGKLLSSGRRAAGLQRSVLASVLLL